MSVKNFAHEFHDVLLTVKDVTRSLGGKVIIRDVDFVVRDVVRPDQSTGQIIALLGPSGMGKTTLFRVLAGLLPPDRGSVLVGPKQVPVTAGAVGVVFQQYRLFEHRTVFGNLLLAARRTGSRSDAARCAKEMLSRFGLDEFLYRYPVQLSGGQRQRVAIAQQFLCSQHFLLMDEPFSGLDPLAVDRVCKTLTEVANLDELNTVVIVTHNIEAGLRVADTVLLLGRDHDAGGKIIPGARIQNTYDLMERGLAWREGVEHEPEFRDLAREIKEKFAEL
jgi:NitT/TauT family transport system ATP-binding protein